ncbi:MAG: hypothetical protein IJL33_05790 [Ruminococcus sp.]|uniref:Uncharacterized protein n=1 Tax=Ruminococcus flavefaciens TaxID=1265 RepID=A0A1K1Q455_RUMFL|nr:hypothetical protein [Ruminococcus flavefaciens]MBQ6034989.1 hypothetical protein [Ruminococcus sp.]SFW54473.1 hypothetical protein SAMN02910280_0364 [Ruminococcus flavefaciens]
MSRGNGFFSNLKKSTKITLVSCGCFIALTAVILTFFVMFPITPSEKMISSFGRESIYKQDPQSTSPTTAVTTTATSAVSKTKRTTTVTKVKKSDYTITFTSGNGFFKGQKIPSGDFSGQLNTYTPTTTTSVVSGYEGGTGELTTYPNGEGTTLDPNGGTGTGTETPVTPPEGGAGTGTETPVTPPDNGGAGTGGETAAPAPADGGAAAAAE